MPQLQEIQRESKVCGMIQGIRGFWHLCYVTWCIPGVRRIKRSPSFFQYPTRFIKKNNFTTNVITLQVLKPCMWTIIMVNYYTRRGDATSRINLEYENNEKKSPQTFLHLFFSNYYSFRALNFQYYLNIQCNKNHLW